MDITRNWKGYWINAANVPGAAAQDGGPVPYLRKTLLCERRPRNVRIYLCGLGYHVLYVNGNKADDRVLAPVMSQYNEHASYIEYDVTALFRRGKNAVVVLLGNGLYNQDVIDSWKFAYASWRDTPRMLCDIVVDGRTAAISDASWKVP